MSEFLQTFEPGPAGIAMYQMATKLYPICRSITGDGFRESLMILQQQIELEIHEVPTDTRVFDWTIPMEWNIRDAYVKNSWGEKVIDFQKSNLHLVNYSLPVHTKIALPELKEHLFTIPEHPDWIPYRTTYYKETWGFCLSFNQLQQLDDDEYEVCINSSLTNGYLTYGEYYLAGKTSEEILISCHCCHPSLCNDNLSGIALSTYLAKLLTGKQLKYSYRFLFIPGTIGAITWLSLNKNQVHKIKHGLVVACVGDPGYFHYKKSRRGNAEIDQVVEYVLKSSGKPYEIEDFTPYGYDERQYCSPGFNLPVGSLTRTPHSRYPEYHTSADNLDFIQPEYLAYSLVKYLNVIDILEHNRRYVNTNPMCEPQLGRRGLYSMMGGKTNIKDQEMAILWVLNLSDGQNSLLDIADKSGMDFSLLENAASMLSAQDLLVEISR